MPARENERVRTIIHSDPSESAPGLDGGAPATAGTGDAKRPWGWLAALAVGLALAAPAWGVVVDVTVTGPDGEPVAGATVDLGLGIPPVETGEDGRATVEVEQELVEKERETVAVILFPPDPHTGERRREEVPVKLGPQRLVLRVGPPPPGTGAQPPRPLLPELPALGCLANGGRFELQAGLGNADFDNTPLDSQFTSRTFLMNGMVASQSAGPTSAAGLAEINGTQKKNHQLDTEGKVKATVPMRPGICGRTPGSRGLVAVPAFTLGWERVDATFESLLPDMRQFDQRFWGEGNTWSGGLDLAFFRPGSRHYAVVGVGYAEGDNTAVRTVDVAGTFFPQGAFTVSDSGRYDRETLWWRLLYGHSFAGDRVAVQLGARHVSFDAELRMDSVVDVSALFPTAPPGTQVLVEDAVVNLFSDEYVQAVVEVIASLGGPVVLRGEGFAGDGSSGFNFAVGFRF